MSRAVNKFLIARDLRVIALPGKPHFFSLCAWPLSKRELFVAGEPPAGWDDC